MRKFIKITVFISLIFLFSTIVDARFGGGGGFRGGGRSSGGGFGGSYNSRNGSDGLGLLIKLLIINHPYIGIPSIIIIVLIMGFAGQKTKNSYVSGVIRSGYKKQNGQLKAAALEKLMSRDENFSVDLFIDRVKQSFVKLQDAWGNQNIKPVKHFISDGIFEKCDIQLKIQKKSLLKNVTTGLNISNISLAGVESDNNFDTIHLAISATAIDQYFHSETGRKLVGSSTPETFTEYWSFLRKPGTKTINKPGLLEGFCPNCGSPIKLNDKAECQSCEAIVQSGEYDWVLAEITQASEWSFQEKEEVRGLSTLTEKDKSFNIQHIEDRVSVMFYRNQAAEFFSDEQYIAKIATNNFMGNNRSKYKKHEGMTSFFADSAIGSVELVEAIVDENSEYDKLSVKVKWSGHRTEAILPSLIKPEFHLSHIYIQEYVLIRKSDATTNNQNSILSVHCPNCGAPEKKDDKNVCGYCFTPLNDGSKEWVLDEIKPFIASFTKPLTTENQPLNISTMGTNSQVPLSVINANNVITTSVAVMLADGVIDDKEMKMLEDMASVRHITKEKLSTIISSVKSKSILIPEPNTPQEGKELLRNMVLMCLADGKVEKSELSLIHKLTEKMGYSELDINMMIKSEKSRLYKIAKKIKK